MDCAALRSDIEKLRQELQTLEMGAEKIREAKEHNGEFRDVAKIINSNSADSVLEKYLKDFRERNPELLSGFTLGERMEFMDTEGNPRQVNSIAIAEDGRVLVGGDGGVLYLGFYGDEGIVLDERMEMGAVSIHSIAIDKDGSVLIGGDSGVLFEGFLNGQNELVLGEQIYVANAGGWTNGVYSVAFIDDGRRYALIGGYDGAFHVGFYDEQGELTLIEPEDIRSAYDKPASIFSIKTTRDGYVLLGGDDGAFYACSWDDWRHLTLGGRIDIKNANGSPADIRTIAAIDDEHMLIGGLFGTFYEGSYKGHGGFALGERLDVRDANGELGSIFSIVAIGGGHVLIGGSNGTFYDGFYDDKGKFKLGERIDIRDADGAPVDIYSIATIGDGRVLIGGKNGVFCTGSYDVSLEALKRHLPEIIEKGEA